MSTLAILAAPLPVGTLVEHPDRLATPRPPLMKRMCCGRLSGGEACGMVLGWVVCVRAMDGQISHGMCEACVERSLDGLATELATAQEGAR